MIIAQTIKGKGISFMENNPDFHGKAPNQKELVLGLEELGYSDTSLVQEMRNFGLSDDIVSSVLEAAGKSDLEVLR